MKLKIFLSLLLLCLCIANLQAQKANRFVDSLLHNRIIRIPAYEIDSVSNQTLILPMNYGQSTFIDTTGFSILKNSEILSVDLLFTDYPSADNLFALNGRRLNALISLLPGIDKRPNITWTITRQTDGNTKESAEKLIHGFVINYRKPYDSIAKEKELILIQSVTPDSIPDSLLTPPKTKPAKPAGKTYYWGVMHGGTYGSRSTYNKMPVIGIVSSRKQDPARYDEADTLLAISQKEAFDKNILDKRQLATLKSTDSIYLVIPKRFFKTTDENKTVPKERKWTRLEFTQHKDSSVLTILNKKQFNKALVIIDVTGSMAPYSAQVVEWLSAHEKSGDVAYISCFNDGDEKDDLLKPVGSTGGIYTERFRNARQASALIQKAMSKGDGGDFPENVCEGIIKAINAAPQAQDVILIADSWAPARDIELASQIKKPVQVIVCGKRIGVHTHYVTIALLSGGSLHFMNEETIDLTPLKQGKEMMINQRLYKFDGERVKLVAQ